MKWVIQGKISAVEDSITIAVFIISSTAAVCGCTFIARNNILARNEKFIRTGASDLVFLISFFYLSFLSRTFTIHRAAEEGGSVFIRSLPLPPLPPASQTLRKEVDFVY